MAFVMMSCHILFRHAVKAVRYILQILTLVWNNQRNNLDIAVQCGKRMHICKRALSNDFRK
jgi:hypothetical protein